MKHTELQRIQRDIKFDAPSMALCLGVDYEQYRRFYYGHSKIVPQIEKAARELEKKNQNFLKQFEPGGQYQQELNREFPRGFRSE